MNHKQKLGYMALGAAIMAIGIIIGQFVTPDIEAQSNGVFDEITCRRLTVVDQNGKERIRLNSDKELGASISIVDQNEKAVIALGSFSDKEISTALVIFDQNGKKAIALGSFSDKAVGNAITIFDKNEKTAIALGSFSDKAVGNSVMVRDTLTGEFEKLD